MHHKTTINTKEELCDIIMSGKDFNQYDYSSITDINHMFHNIKEQIPNISKLNTHNITNMSHMFRESSFNQNISSWDVSSVIDVSYMFYHSPSNQDLSSWLLSNNIHCDHMFDKIPSNNILFLPSKLRIPNNLYSITQDIEKSLRLLPSLKMLNYIKKVYILDDFQYNLHLITYDIKI